MQRVSGMVIVFLLLAGMGCSSSGEPMAMAINAPLGPPEGAVPLSGPAVDEGIVCSAATFERVRIVDSEGATLTEEQLSEDTLLSAMYDEFTCTDGSGAFVVVQHPSLAQSDMDFEGSNDVGPWEIDSGTGDYETLSGDGTLTVDFSAGTVVYGGEVQDG